MSKPPEETPENGPPSAEETAASKARLTDSVKGYLGLLAAAAGILFVVLNSAYVHFYERVGIRPEDVGFDKGAVLGRTAAFGLLFTGATVAAVVLESWVRNINKPWIKLTTGFLAALVAGYMLLRIEGSKGEVFLSTLIATQLVFTSTLISGMIKGIAKAPPGKSAWKWPLPKDLRSRIRLLIIATAILTAGFYIAESVIVSRRADKALASGAEVTPVSLFAYPIFDISAVPAHATWIDKDTTPPQDLMDPNLLVLGRTQSYVVFLSCGHSVVIPNLKVSVELLQRAEPRREDEKEAAEKLRRAFCDCVKQFRTNCIDVIHPPAPTRPDSPKTQAPDPVPPIARSTLRAT